MFVQREAPLDLTEKQVLGLRRSLNSPVIAVEGYHAGPARAAILTHEEADGQPNLTVAIRLEESGHVVLYSFEGDMLEASGLGLGTDAALSFAETMGFLFDDEELGVSAGDPERLAAFECWQELVTPGSGGEPEPADEPAPDAGSEAEPAPESADEVWLEEVQDAEGEALALDDGFDEVKAEDVLATASRFEPEGLGGAADLAAGGPPEPESADAATGSATQRRGPPLEQPGEGTGSGTGTSETTLVTPSELAARRPTLTKFRSQADHAPASTDSAPAAPEETRRRPGFWIRLLSSL